MVTAEELTVAIRSEGVSETQDDLEGVERSMDDTASSAGDSAEELEGFSKRFQGAMSAAVAALAVGAAGLLSQVPVIGEVFSGLAAIVSALAFQMDGVLRPVLSPLTDLFFSIADGIFAAEGAFGSLLGAVTSVLAILGVLIPVIAKVGSFLGVWVSTGAGVLAILGKIGAAVGALIGIVGGLPIALVGAVAAIAAFAAAYALNLGGVRDTTDAIWDDIKTTVVQGALRLAAQALSAIGDFADDVEGTFTGIASTLSSWASDLASDAYGWGRSLIQRFIAGIQSAIARVRDFLGDLRSIGGRIGIDVPDLGGLGGGGGGSGGGGSGRPRFGGSGSRGGQTIDGRQITESTGRYRADSGRRRGL